MYIKVIDDYDGETIGIIYTLKPVAEIKKKIKSIKRQDADISYNEIFEKLLYNNIIDVYIPLDDIENEIEI